MFFVAVCVGFCTLGPYPILLKNTTQNIQIFARSTTSQTKLENLIVPDCLRPSDSHIKCVLFVVNRFKKKNNQHQLLPVDSQQHSSPTWLGFC